MPYSLSQLRVFEAVARYGNYTRAAEQLNMTQPAVSMHIQQFEEAVGLPLLERKNKRSVPTPAGAEILQYTSQVLNAYNDLLAVINRQKGEYQQRLVLAITTSANFLVSQLLRAFSQLHPEIQVHLDISDHKTLLANFENHEPDFAIMGEPPRNRGLQSERFLLNPLVVIASPQHPLVQRHTKVSLDEVLAERFMLRTVGSGTRGHVERHLRSYGKAFSQTFEMPSHEAIKQAVAAGLGLGVVSLHTIQAEIMSGHLVVLNVEHFPIDLHWYVVMRKGKQLSPLAQVFKEFALAEAERFIHWQ